MASNNLNATFKVGAVEHRPVLLQPELGGQSAALFRAWKTGQLSPAALKFLTIARVGTRQAGRSANYAKATIVSLPEAVVHKLLTVSADPNAARQLLVQGFLSQPASVKRDLQNLVNQKQILPEQALAIRQAVETSLFQGHATSLNAVLFQLPFKIVQSILNARQATMEAFFKSWSESLALNAKLNKEAAKRVQMQSLQEAKTRQNASEIARQTKKNHQVFSDKVTLALQSQLLKQRQVVFVKANKLFVMRQDLSAGTVITSTASVEDSLAYFEHSGVAGSALLGSSEQGAHIATFEALESPREDLGPRLGLRRGGSL